MSRTLENNYQNSGRRPKYPLEEVSQLIEETIQKNRDANSLNIKRKFEENTKIRYTSPTIRKKRKTMGYVGKTPITRLQVTNQTIEKRIKYCKDNSKNKFTTTLFVDEAIVQLNKNRTVVWYKPGEEPRHGGLHRGCKN